MRELKNTKIIAVDAVEYSLKQALPLFLSGLTAGMVQREPQISNVINLKKFRLL